MQFLLDQQGIAENAHLEALAELDGGYARLRDMAAVGHPGACAAMRFNRKAYADIISANQAMNGITGRAA